MICGDYNYETYESSTCQHTVMLKEKHSAFSLWTIRMLLIGKLMTISRNLKGQQNEYGLVMML